MGAGRSAWSGARLGIVVALLLPLGSRGWWKAVEVTAPTISFPTSRPLPMSARTPMSLCLASSQAERP